MAKIRIKNPDKPNIFIRITLETQVLSGFGEDPD